MSLVTTERSIIQLIISFAVGAGISIGTTIVFGFVLTPFVGLLLSIGVSIVFAYWTRAIDSRRLWGSFGHVLVYSIINFQIQNWFIEALQTFFA